MLETKWNALLAQITFSLIDAMARSLNENTGEMKKIQEYHS